MDKTPNLGLNKPSKGFRDWDVPLNENWDILDEAGNGKLNITQDNIPQKLLSGGGTINLTVGTFKQNCTANTIYVLPSPISGMLNEIEISLNLTNTYSVNVATNVFVNNTAPDLSKAGSYTLIWLYDWNKSAWVCGGFKNGA